MTASPDFDLSSVLKEIYINPIQNIVIIDDDYKTPWDVQKIAEGSQSLQKTMETEEITELSISAKDEDGLYEESSSSNPESEIKQNEDLTPETIEDIAQKIIESCKDEFILHVDNRPNTPDKIIDKADFLILDYYLTKDKNPRHSIDILKKYIEREKFSPVIIHSSLAYEAILHKIFPKIKTPNKKYEENYIFGDGFFIVIINKSKDNMYDIHDFFNKILEKMKKYPPTPLFMFVQACIKSINYQSHKISNSIFSNAATRAGILYNTLSQHIEAECHDDEIRLRCKDLIERIFEDIGIEIRADVESNAKQIFAELLSTSTEHAELLTLTKQKENSEHDELDIMLRLNAHLCSYEHKFDHITTGTVLKQGQNYYLCTSPSCDCVPGRGNSKTCQRNKLNPANYFFACKLDKIGNDTKRISIQNPEYKNKSPLALAERGKHIFISQNGEVNVFQVIDPANQPKPYIFYTPNGGYVKSQDQTINVQFTSYDKENNKLTLNTKKMKVIGQLRHLHASNLLQKFGMHNSRIGVDFKTYLPTVTIDENENNT